MKHFTAAGRSTLLVLVMCLVAREAHCGFTIPLGGTVGWTNKANIDYTQWLSNYKVKIGDSMQFNNFDGTDHSVIGVDKLGYDTCLSSGKKLTGAMTISPGISFSVTFTYSGDFYAICEITTHCIQGQKVYIQVLNTDGTANTTASPSNPGKSAAPAMPGLISWTSQVVIVVVATFSLLVAATSTM